MAILQYLTEYLLNEGLGVVFHGTELPGAIGVLKTDCFNLSPTVGSNIEVELNKDKYYFLSTSRSVTGRYIVAPGSDRPKKDVLFELDADAINSKLQSTPVDYWAGDPSFSETEERFVSDDDKLCPAHKFISSIHVFVYNKDNMLSLTDNYKRTYFTQLFHLNELAKHHQIPIYYYDNVQNYITRKNGISLEGYLEQNEIDNENKFDKLDFDYMKRNRSKRLSPLDAVLSFYSGEKIPSEIYKYLENKFKYGGVGGAYAQDFIIDLKNIIQSARKGNSFYDDSNIEQVKHLINIMKQSKIKTIDDFIKNKFYPDMTSKFKWM